jgi:hypothetical protein
MPPNPYRRQPNINDMMYPKGSRQPRQVWAAVMNVPQPSSGVPDTTPTPTPSNTPTGTPASTTTPTPTNTNTPTPSNTPTGTPASTPTMTPTTTTTLTPSPTTTLTSTPTPSPTPPISDSGATIFLNAVITTGGTLNETISAATQQLFYSLRNDGILDKLDTMYPIIGGVANSHALNALSVGTYYGTFNGGWTHSVSGATPNGINAYISVGYNPNSNGNDVSLGGYTNEPGYTGTLLGGYDGVTDLYQVRLNTPSGQANLQASSTLASATNKTLSITQGFIAVARRDNTTLDYVQNSSAFTSTETYAPVNANIFIGARYANGGVDSYGNKRIAFIFEGKKLTASELQTLYSRVQTFQTSLGRQV